MQAELAVALSVVSEEFRKASIEARLRCTLFASDGSDEQIELVSEKLVFAVGVE